VRSTRRALFAVAIAIAIAPPAIAFLWPLNAALARPGPGAWSAARGADGGASTPREARDPGCIYGKVLDGHTGEIRCLSPEEITPPGPYDIPQPPDGGVDASAPAFHRVRLRDAGEAGVGFADGAIPLRAVSITVDSVDFENGDVPRAQGALERFAKKDLVRCANEHDWSPGKRRANGDAHVVLRFLVRAPGRAEGIDVSGARGLSAGLIQCITSALANRPIGAPSNDPVAVSVRFRFR
jgi:hypothetical protein